MVDERVAGNTQSRRSAEPRLERSAALAAALATVATLLAGVATAVGAALTWLPADAEGTAETRDTWSPSDVPTGLWLGLVGVIILGVLTLLLREWLAARRSAAAQEKAERALQGLKGTDDLLGFISANASQMHAYDLMARRQAAQSHRASLVAMFVGLVLVASGVAVAVLAPDTVSKVAGASVTSIGAVVGGYIARTFVVNGRRSSDNAAYYFQQPLVTSYLLTAERLLLQLPETERPQALSMIIDAVLRQAGAAARASESVDADQ